MGRFRRAPVRLLARLGGFNWAAVDVPANWPHNFTGFAAHWNKNSNLGTAVDQWFLNLFPRPKPFVANDGGYLTSSFIPTLGTMLLGLIAGRWLKTSSPEIPFKRFLLTGTLCLAAAGLLHFTGICPVVKRIWTPSWTLFSGGLCFFLLSAFCWVIDKKGYEKVAFPLTVIGRNSIAAYLIAELCRSFVSQSLYINLGHGPFEILGNALEPFLLGLTMLLIYWLVLFWMYRRNIFLRI
jgi:predicted acyltransferase